MKFSKYNQPKKVRTPKARTPNTEARQQEKVNAAMNHMKIINEREDTTK